jgi:formylglycine-generating enzyme required for sulfatase activity
MIALVPTGEVMMHRHVAAAALAVIGLALLGCPNPEEPADIFSPTIGKLICVPAGTFQRDATVTNTSTVSAFLMSETEITREQYLAVAGTDPSGATHSSGTGDPVQNASWYAALVFCNTLSALEGLAPVFTIKGSTDPDDWGAVPGSTDADWDAAIADWSAAGYRLPTEMEWMWATMGARDGSTGCLKPFAGSTGSNAIGDCAWYGFGMGGSATVQRTNPPGSLDANELGLYDMSGNVWEWCWDWWDDYPTGSLTDYRGPTFAATERISRGGSWSSIADYCAIAERNNGRASPWASTGDDMGFRVVRRR